MVYLREEKGKGVRFEDEDFLVSFKFDFSLPTTILEVTRRRAFRQRPFYCRTSSYPSEVLPLEFLDSLLHLHKHNLYPILLTITCCLVSNEWKSVCLSSKSFQALYPRVRRCG